jgi:H+/gluconate symporter-like permease
MARVSLFVVVFAVYPFAAEMFRQGKIPKRLIPGTIALGAFTFTMDSLPGTPQIQNIIPTTFFKTDTWAAPWLGVTGALFILVVGLTFLDWRRRKAAEAGEGYGEGRINEPEEIAKEDLVHPAIAILPLFVVGVLNLVFTVLIPKFYGTVNEVQLAGMAKPLATPVSTVAAIWAVEGALLMGNPHGPRLRVPAGQPKIRRGHQGGGCGLPPRLDEHRLGVRLRGGDRLAAGVPGDP